MPYQATVFNVMIASPGDLTAERDIVRTVIHEWNTVHSFTRKTVLIPVGWETHSTPLMGDRPQAIINQQVLKDSDLLIAIFWTRLGTPTGEAASGTVEEIERHVKANRPAMIYFSTTPIDPDSLDSDQYQALKAFKAECQTRGLYETYGSTTEFRDKVRHHLGMTLNANAYFKAVQQASENVDIVSHSDSPAVPQMTQEARELLIEAVSGDGSIAVVHYLSSSAVMTNRRNFVDLNDPRSRATWEGAVDELVKLGLLKPPSHVRKAYRVTRLGYEIAELLRA